MNIAKPKNRSSLLIAALALFFIAITLFSSTWQTITHNQEAEEEHLRLTTQAMLSAVENSLHSTPSFIQENQLSKQMNAFFLTLEQEDDLLFAGIFSAKTQTLFTSSSYSELTPTLPQHVIDALVTTGSWHGRLRFESFIAYVAAQKIGSSKLRHLDLANTPTGPLFVLIGIDTNKHLSSYKSFQRNALFQALYIFIAALFVWGLTLSFLSRWEQDKKATRLEEFQNALLDNLPDGLLTLEKKDQDFIIQSVNPAALHILHRTFHSLIGQPLTVLPTAIVHCVTLPDATHPTCWQKITLPSSGNQISVPQSEILVPHGSEAMTAHDSETLRPHDAQNLEQHSGFPVTKNALFTTSASNHAPIVPSLPTETVQLEVRLVPIQSEEHKEFMLLLRDRTELHTLEKELLAAEKLATIGSLATGIAHEVRNPLSAIRGFAQYFVKKLAGKQPEEEYAKTIMNEADRLNRVVTDLLFLARPKDIHLTSLPLIPFVKNIGSLLRFDLDKQKVDFVELCEAPVVFADADALQQILLNLCLNSLAAFTEKNMPTPTLTIASGKSTLGIWIEVRDNGKGMHKKHIHQAFEPFFTLRHDGTGLGLSLVERLMHAQGGTALLCSESGQGTTVRLVFPEKPPIEQMDFTSYEQRGTPLHSD